MSESNVVDLTKAAAKRDARKYRFTPLSAIERREAEGRRELALWAEKYQDLGAHYLAENGSALLMMADMLKFER